MTSYPPPQPYSQSGPPQPHRPPTPWYKRLWFLLTATAVVALFIGVAAGGGDKAKTKTLASTQTETATLTAPPLTLRPTATTTVTARPVINRIVKTQTRTRTKTYTPPPKPSFGDGVYEVGSDIDPGKFRTDGGDGDDCYYEVDSSLDGGIDSIVSNDNFGGPSIVRVRDGQYFKVSGGCDWRHV